MSGIGHNQNVMNVNSLSSEQKQQLKKGIQELDDSMTRVAAERELQKEAIADLAEKLGLDKKLIRRMAKVHHKANFSSEMEENKMFEEFYEGVLK